MILEENNVFSLIKTKLYPNALDLKDEILYNQEDLLLLFPYSIEHSNYKSKYNTKRNLNLLNLMAPYRYHSLVNSNDHHVMLEVKGEKKKEEPLFPLNIDIDELIDSKDKLISYLYFYFKFKKRFFLEQVEEYQNSHFLGELRASYENDNYYLNNNYHWHNLFQDPIIQKLINFLNKKGKKEKSERMVYKMLQLIRIKYNLNPIVFIRTALNNIKPILKTENIPFRRRTQAIPNLIPLKKQYKLAFKWLITEVMNNSIKKPYYYKLYLAFANAFFQKGFAFDSMIQTHKLAYDQRAYMYKNYYLKKKKKIKFLNTNQLIEEAEQSELNY